MNNVTKIFIILDSGEIRLTTWSGADSPNAGGEALRNAVYQTGPSDTVMAILSEKAFELVKSSFLKSFRGASTHD